MTAPICQPPIDEESAVCTVTVHNARWVESKKLFALVDVELVVGGVSLMIYGVQARRILNPDGVSVHLPTYKTDSGTWRAAIGLPPELYKPLAEAVLSFLAEEGLTKPKYGATGLASRPA